MQRPTGLLRKQPLFLTNKLNINELGRDVNVHDYQLRDHFINMNNLYELLCECTRQKHCGRPCAIVHEPKCMKCGRETRLLVPYTSLLFHGDMETKKLTYSEEGHIHKPPCRRCCNCKTGLECCIRESFTCHISTDVVSRSGGIRFNRMLTTDQLLTNEHVYDIKRPLFYLCQRHKHYHQHLAAKDICYVQTRECCEQAIHIQQYHHCFMVTVQGAKRRAEYIIFDPQIWREQSFNKFMSFIRAVICAPEAVKDRYKSFENSNFSIANIKRYKSGKASIIRTAVTGFETQGLYQTATISCLIPYYVKVIPRKLYQVLAEQHYDLDYVLVKRDPSLLPTCMYVCALYCQPDDDIETTTISDQLSKGMNQDQDGDKNADYFIRTRCAQQKWDARDLYDYRVAKMELAAAFRNKCTLLGRPRYVLSETTLLILERHREQLRREPTNVYFKKTHRYGVQFVNDASAGYLRDEYDEFQRLLQLYNYERVPLEYVTFDDLTLAKDRLSSGISSGAKGTFDLLQLFLDNIEKTKPLVERKQDMIDLCNKYIVSNQDLSRNGRKQFTSLYASQDLVSFNENIYINKVLYADFSNFATAVYFQFAEVSLELFLKDLRTDYKRNHPGVSVFGEEEDLCDTEDEQDQVPETDLASSI